MRFSVSRVVGSMCVNCGIELFHPDDLALAGQRQLPRGQLNLEREDITHRSRGARGQEDPPAGDVRRETLHERFQISIAKANANGR
jgi:hypothetical protein